MKCKVCQRMILDGVKTIASINPNKDYKEVAAIAYHVLKLNHCGRHEMPDAKLYPEAWWDWVWSMLPSNNGYQYSLGLELGFQYVHHLPLNSTN